MSHQSPRLVRLHALWAGARALLIDDAPGAGRRDDDAGTVGDAGPPAEASTGVKSTDGSTTSSRSRSAGAVPAARTRVRRAPDGPGRWTLTRLDGSSSIVRVIDRNGRLYVVRGRFLAVAVPIAHFEGDWTPLD